MPRPFVAFDESGNTGEALLDASQPIFALASVHLPDDVAKHLVDVVRLPGSGDVKFQKLKKHESGKNKVLKLLNESTLTKTNCKTYVIDKKFFAVTKLVDVLLEPVAFHDGLNLYDAGRFLLNTAELLHVVGPVFLGGGAYADLIQRFVLLLRERDDTATAGFYNYLKELFRNQNIDRKFLNLLAPFLVSYRHIDNILGSLDLVGKTTLDPAIPSFVCLCDAWGNELQQTFDIAHDTSKPIKHQQLMLEHLMANDEPEFEAGLQSSRLRFPLKANGIEFFESENTPQIQLSDVLAGATAFAFAKKASKDSDFQEELKKQVLHFLVGGIMPSSSESLTPNENGLRNTSALDYTMRLLERQQAKRQSSSE